MSKEYVTFRPTELCFPGHNVALHKKVNAKNFYALQPYFLKSPARKDISSKLTHYCEHQIKPE